MKKGLLLAGAAALSMTAFAQTQTVNEFEATQARLLNIESNAFFKPLIVELDIIGGKANKKYPLTRTKVNSFKGDVSEIRSWAVFQLSKDLNADVIVGAIFDIVFNSSTGEGYVEIIGYPAKFKNWRTMENSDLEWIRTTKSLDATEIEKIKPIIKK